MAGLVYANEMRLDKPGEKISQDTEITVKGQVMPYVSRGGYKLEKALETFHLDLQDKVMIDIGSSTGGFTDCASKWSEIILCIRCRIQSTSVEITSR